MIYGEAESYKAINSALASFCPEVKAVGRCAESKNYFLVTSFLDFAAKPSTSLANSLARLHSASTDKGFGFHVATCCADTVQDNSWNPSWSSFFINQRLKPIAQLRDNAIDAELQRLVADTTQASIPRLLDALKIKPALIHGDLWSGNERNGKVFDSCACYAHSEFELSIMRMFGGFTSDIEEYHRLIPKDDPREEYDDRQRLYQVYHQLNHSGTGQGSSYREAAKRTLRALNRKYEDAARSV